MKRLILLVAALMLGAGCQAARAPADQAAPETTFPLATSPRAPSPAAASPAAGLPARPGGTSTPPPPTVAVPSVTTPIAATVVSPTGAATPLPSGAAAIPAATPLLPGQPTPGPAQPAARPEEVPAATPTPWLPQTQQVGQVRVRLLEYVRGQTPDGRPVVRLQTELINEGDRAAFFADLYFSLRTADGQQIEPITNVVSEERMQQGPLAPGESTTGFLWYLVTETTRIASIQYDGPTGQTSFPVPG